MLHFQKQESHYILQDSQLAQQAKGQERHFLTVDAFHEEGYSATPFYEKNHFIAVEDYKKEQDTQRMFLFVG